MENLAFRIKLSVLWILLDLASFGTTVVMVLMEPGMMEEIMSGVVEGMKLGPGLLLILAIMVLVPIAMAFLSLTLKGSGIRWLNIILGILYVVIELPDVVKITSAHGLLMIGSLILIPALIAWYAWKWPKQEA